MDRLTKRNSDDSVGIPQNRYYNYNDFQKVMSKLADYEDAEEKGLLFKVDCRCKDRAYVNYDGCLNTTCYCRKNGCFMQENDFCIYAKRTDKEIQDESSRCRQN